MMVNLACMCARVHAPAYVRVCNCVCMNGCVRPCVRADLTDLTDLTDLSVYVLVPSRAKLLFLIM